MRRCFLPAEAREHRRTADNRNGNLEINAEEMRQSAKRGEERRQQEEARRATERAAAAERQRQQAAREAEEQAATERELGGSLAMHMASMMDTHARRMSPEDTRNLHTALKSIFGNEGLKKEHWPYDFSEHGLKTKITRVSASGRSISLEMQIYNAQGQPIMEGWSRRWSKGDDGRPAIENSFMSVNQAARTGVQVGNLINHGQRKMMRSIPGGGTTHVHANIDIGGYNWCNQGFSWDRSSDASGFRQRLKMFADQHGIQLTDEDLRHFKEPVHFASFDDGKRYVMKLTDNPRTRGGSLPLSQKQKDAGTLSGNAGEHPLTPEEIRSGKTERMVVHLGKKFMLGTDWYGTWDSAKETDASKFADKYYEIRDRATEHLNPQFKQVLADVKAGRRGRGSTQEAPRPAVARASFQSAPAGAEPHEQHTDRYVRYWQREGRNITMSPRRMRTVASWSPVEIKSFMARAPISPAAKRRLRELLRGSPTT